MDNEKTTDPKNYYRTGGSPLIRSIAAKDWDATPSEVRQLATEVRRLRATLEDVDLIEGKTVIRVEINFGSSFGRFAAGLEKGHIILTAPDRIEGSDELGAAATAAVRETLIEWTQAFTAAFMTRDGGEE